MSRLASVSPAARAALVALALAALLAISLSGTALVALAGLGPRLRGPSRVGRGRSILGR